MTPHEQVLEFHRVYGHPVGKDIANLNGELLSLRMDLIGEEWEELNTAVEDEDVVETIDALADMVYVIYGMAICMGVNLDDVMAEVHRSNMSKLDADGKPIYREDNKVLKGPNYSPPQIETVLAKQSPL